MSLDGYALVLALLLLPALGNWAGGALAELVPVSRRTLSLALHAAAGIVLAVVGLELVPEALKATPHGYRCWPSWAVACSSSPSTP